MREVKAENDIACLQHSCIGGGVSLRSRVRLHIRMFRTKDLFGAIARQVLDHVGVLASPVVAPARIALGVLVREGRPGSLQHCFRDEIFAGDHLQPLVLAESLVIDGGGYFGIGLGKGQRHADIHRRILWHPAGRKICPPQVVQMVWRGVSDRMLLQMIWQTPMTTTIAP